MLRGPSGCGKTAILREFVRRRLLDDENEVFLQTNTSMMLAGTKWSGELETRIKALIDLARRPSRVMLYFSDLHLLMQAGQTVQSESSVGTFLGPYVESGELLIVGECTPEAYRRGFEASPSLKRLFPAIDIEEPSPASAEEVVRDVARQTAEAIARSQSAQIVFDELLLHRVLELAAIYFAGQSLPGRAIELLEQVFALVREELQSGAAPGPRKLVVGQEMVIGALQRSTGIPCRLLDDNVPLDLAEVREFFESRVLGQPDAIDAVVDLITLIKAGVTDPGKPMGVLLFVGPTGVGKTEMAKVLAEYIFGSPERMLRFDMSEFKDYNSFEKLIGSQSARDNSPLQAGSLISQVRQQPFSVILLDEIEKAHANLFDVFLQMFGEGRLTDPLGRTTSFTQTIVILTSNVGSDLAAPATLGFNAPEEPLLNETIRAALAAQFRPEFLNRLDRVVDFQPLSRESARRIAQRELGRVLLRSGLTRRRIRINVNPGVINVLLRKGFSRRYGARPLKRTVERLALLPIAQQAIKLQSGGDGALLRLVPAGDTIRARVVSPSSPQAARPPTRGVAVFDPVRKKKVRRSPAQLARETDELVRRVAELEEIYRGEGLPEQKADLLQRTTAVNFWDDPDAARTALGSIYRLDRLLETLRAVRKRTADLTDFVQAARRSKDPHAWLQVAERVQEVRRHVELAGFSLRCRGPLDSCDAFLEIRLIDHEPPPDDVAGLLGEMYGNWARSKGFTVTTVNEKLLEEGPTKTLTLLIEGNSIYGVLRGEAGIHEMLYDKTSKATRQSKYVRVRVLPSVDPAMQSLPEELEIEKLPAKGAGRRVQRYQSHLVLADKEGSVSVEGKCGLKEPAALALLRELARAELYRRHSESGTVAAVNAGDARDDDVIRRYTMRPSKSVKDQRTGVKRSGLADLWNGALDDFLEAYIAMAAGRSGADDAAVPPAAESRAGEVSVGLRQHP